MNSEESKPVKEIRKWYRDKVNNIFHRMVREESLQKWTWTKTQLVKNKTKNTPTKCLWDWREFHYCELQQEDQRS